MDIKKKLSREEKISQFDELRKNYCAMMKSLKFYEEECSKLTKNDSEQVLPKPSDVKKEKLCDEVSRKENPNISQESSV